MGTIEATLDGLSVLFTRGGERVYASADRGIGPLVAAVDGGTDYSGCDATDRIVGKAAALLYVLLRVNSVSAHVMTNRAKDILTAGGIACRADVYTDNIINRKGDGLCPMELAVSDIDDACAALKAIRDEMLMLQAGRAIRP